MPKDTRKPPPNPANFYAQVLNEAESQEFQAASNLEGVDDEISLMRLRIKELIRQQEDIDSLARATNALCRLVATRYAISKQDKKSMKAAMLNVLRDIALPLGIVVGEKLTK